MRTVEERLVISKFNKWHFLAFFQILLMVTFMAMIFGGTTFIQYVPPFYCDNPLHHQTNWTLQQILNFSSPFDADGKIDFCHEYNVNLTQYIDMTFDEAVSQKENTNQTSLPTITCKTSNIRFQFIDEGMQNSVVSQFFVVLFGLLNAFMPYFQVYMATKFLIGMFETGSSAVLFIWAMEFLNEKQRRVVGALFWLTFSPGSIIATGLAYLLRDWRWVQAVCALCFATAIILHWVCVALVYGGAWLDIAAYSGNLFINNLIGGLVEGPGYLICFPLLRWARKKSLILCFALAGAFMMLYVAVPKEGFTWGQLVLAFSGQFCIVAAFNLVYVVTAEVNPTPIRGALMAYSSMVGRFGFIISPFVTQLAHKGDVTQPMLILGAVSLFGAVLTWFVPETQGKSLPSTFAEAINLG